MIEPISSKTYPAKVLLLGEYVVLNGADAIAVPFPRFGGAWKYTTIDVVARQYQLKEFAQFLTQPPSAEKAFQIDTQRFLEELSKGLYFDSNIPLGYGVGSSGALCAAVYDVFSIEKTKNISLLQSVFSWLETFFHGSSSGFDPLVSYCNQAARLSENTVTLLPEKLNTTGFFLLDTQITREAGEYISIFMEKKKNVDFIQQLEQTIVPTTTTAIQSFLAQDTTSLFHLFHDISLLQYRYFSEMIPPSFLEIWKIGLKNKYFKLKICGAGGGGFILGFSKDMERTRKKLAEYELITW